MKSTWKSFLFVFLAIIFGSACVFLFIAFRDSLGFSIISNLLDTFQESSSDGGLSATNDNFAFPPADSPTDWLDTINSLRTASGLPLVTENDDWSAACRLHSRYMVKTNTIAHDEDPHNPWYTAEGAAAARNSNVMVSSDTRSPDADAIALWLSQPFHGIGILDPQLKSVGFGSYREAAGKWKMAATLDIVSGNTGTKPSSHTYPVMWPPNGQTTTILSYAGNEWPDPLMSCPGYKAPSGPPIYLQIGDGQLSPSVTATSFQKNGTDIEHCVFDETNYTHPGKNGEQEVGRGSLNSRDVIILIPEKPLTPGAVYNVSITSNNQTYAWSFTATRSPSEIQ